MFYYHLKMELLKLMLKKIQLFNQLIINGIDKNNIYEKIKKLHLKIEKYPFVENKINEQVNLLKNILKSYGYYFVELETSINKMIIILLI